MSFWMQWLTFYPLWIKDLIEISIFTGIIYGWSCWLKQDATKPLLGYFYAYCTLWLVCALAELPTICTFLKASTPVVILLFIIVHQRTLQKNFISLSSYKPAKKTDAHWLEHVIRFCLQADHDLYFLIEHTTPLEGLIAIDIPLHSPMCDALLTYMHACEQFEPDQFMILDTKGYIHGLNARWKKSLALTTLDENRYEKASYLLQDQDGFMLHFKHSTRTFTTILQQKLYKNLSSEQVFQSIGHYLQTKQGTTDAHIGKKARAEKQPHA